MPTRVDVLPMKCTLLDPRYNSGFLIGMSAEEVIVAQSGKFVILNTSTGYGEIADDAEAPIAGWVDLEAQTTSATAGGTKAHCIDDLNAKFIIPLAYDNSTWTVNWAETFMNETCDIDVTANNRQCANITSSSEDDIVAVGGKACTSATANDGFVIAKLYAARALNECA